MMINTPKALLASSTAITLGLMAASASAQVVTAANPTGGTLTTDPFVSGGAPTITNTTPVVVPGGVTYDSTAVESGTTDFQDLGNNDVVSGVSINADVEGVYNTTQTTVTHINTAVPSSVTDPTVENNTVANLTLFDVSGSVGVPVDFVEITSDPSTISGNTVAVTQTNGSFTGGGLTFATYEGTATYVGTNDVDVVFNATPTSETTLNGAGLTTTGDVNAVNVNATTAVTAPSVVTDSVESANGSLHLGTTTGASYVDVNEDDVVIHGGTSSTTVTVNNAGVNIANTTPLTGGSVHFTSVVGGADFTISNTGALSSANTGLNGGAVTVGDDFWVTGEAQIDGKTWLNNDLDVDGNSQFDGNVNVSGNLSSTGNTTLSSGTGSTTVIGQTATNATAGDVTLQAGVANKVVVNADTTAANNNVTISGGSTAALATNVAVSNAGVAITSTTGGAALLIASDGSISSTGAAAGGAVFVNDGLVVGPTSGAALTGNGISTGTVRINTGSSNKITGLADGNIASGSTEAVTGNQLFSTNSRVTTLEAGMIAVNNRVDLLSRRVDKAYQGVAMGFASSAAPLNLANGEGGISGGIGYFQGEWGGAVKAQYVTDAGIGLGLNVGFSSDAVGGGVGASIKF